MPVYHQGRKVKEVYHQGRKVKELWYMGRKVYTSFTLRTVTVRVNPRSGLFGSPSWDTGSVTGDRTLVQYVADGGLLLSANATYTRTDGATSGLSANGVAVRAGEPVPKGVQLTGTAGTYTFLEMAPISGKPVEVMPTTPDNYDAQDWLHATVQKYGQGYKTVKELPFEIDSRNATKMLYMFADCSALTVVPDMVTSQVTNTSFMFQNCSALTDGNVRLIGKHPNVNTTGMITYSGLTRMPFYNSAGQPI